MQHLAYTQGDNQEVWKFTAYNSIFLQLKLTANMDILGKSA